MKTLTTLTAVAALIAGMSIASAQMSPSGSAGSSSSGAKSGKQAATGTGKFCVETSKGGSLNCKFASMSACEKEAQAQGLKCSPNPNAGTTGAK